MFHGVSFRLLDNPSLDLIKDLFSRLRQDGCDTVAIIPQHYISLQPGTANLAPPPPESPVPWLIYPDGGQDPAQPQQHTPEPESVLETARLAAGMGFQVMLKPQIASHDATWRGDISVKDRAADWVWTYRNRFLKRYVDIAKEVDGTILCLGSELVTVTKELGPEFWIGVANWVREQGFGGSLTYAAAWGWTPDSELRRLEALWPHLDYVGVDAYYPLVPPGYSGALDVATLVAAWHRRGVEEEGYPRIDDDLLDITHQAGRPLLFTEIGYGNHQRAAEDPARAAQSDDVRDDDLQLRLAQAFRERWGGVEELAGYFWREARLEADRSGDLGHDIIDRPVEAIVFLPLPGEARDLGPWITPGPEGMEDGAERGLEGAERGLGRRISWNDRPHKGSFTIQGTPTISPTVFEAWLKARRSPALNERPAIDYYRACVTANINPGVALAFFHHESQCGSDKDGVVVRFNTKNWGNLRPRRNGSIGRATSKAENTPWGVFSVYSNFMDGLLDFNDLMNEVYAGKSIPAALQIYAPATDQNDPNSYASVVQMLLDKWDRESGDFDIPGDDATPTPPPTATDYALLGAPTISAATFTQALTAANSPALGEVDAVEYYNLCVSNGVNPAVALAFFKQESEYGTKEGAATRKNWGNLWDKAANALGVYTSWLQSLRDWNVRLQTGAYVAQGPPTIAGIVPLYRGPDRPGNAEYLAGLRSTIEWLHTIEGSRGLDLGPDAGSRDLESGARGLGQYGEWVGAHSSNYTTGRSGQRPIAIVNHVMIGTLAGTIGVFKQPGWDASAHYGVGKDGRVVQFVSENDRAWANGPIRTPNAGVTPWVTDAQQRGINPNDLSVTIEWEGAHRGGKGGTVVFNGEPIKVDFLKGTITEFWKPTPQQYAAGLALIRDIAARNNIALDRAHICRHSDVDSVRKWFCPGDGFPLQQVLDDLKAGAAPPAPGYRLQSPPTITPDAFTQALAAVGSPVLQEDSGANFYNLCVSKGVDPAVALAFFQQETNSGIAGSSRDRKNWGNVLDKASGQPATYPTWREGLAAWCDRLLRSPYTDQGAPTIDTIVPTYRGNRPDNNQYLAQLRARIDSLRNAGRDLGGAQSRDLAPGPEAERGLEAGESGERGTHQSGEWVGTSSDNYTSGRKGRTPVAIVNHVMIGTMAGTIEVFRKPGWGASAHYGVGQDGRVVQFVDEGDTAWANGPIRDPNTGAATWVAQARDNRWDPNAMSITIEWEGRHSGGRGGTVVFNGESLNVDFIKGTITGFWEPTEAQYQAGLGLIREIAARHNIPLDRAHIGRHSDVDSVRKWFCPGDGFPLERLLNDLQGGGAATGTPTGAPAGDTNYRLQGAPTIPSDAFAAALTAVNSPALQETGADTYYQICVAQGIDPAVALGFFQQESNSGLAGGAAERRNWGQLWDRAANAVQTYPTWQEGLNDWCARLQRSPYIDNGPPTIATVVPIYRGNRADNDQYLAQLRARIDNLRGATRDLGPAEPASDRGLEMADADSGEENGSRGLEVAPAGGESAAPRPRRTPKPSGTPARKRKKADSTDDQ